MAATDDGWGDKRGNLSVKEREMRFEISKSIEKQDKLKELIRQLGALRGGILWAMRCPKGLRG